LNEIQSLTNFDHQTLDAESGNTNCLSCGRVGHAIGHTSGVTIYACETCGLWFLNTTTTATEEFYDQHWYVNRPATTEISRYVQDMRIAYSKQIKLLEGLTTGRKIIDVGCGMGIFLKVAKDEGWEVYGTDVSNDACRIAEEHFDVSVKTQVSDYSDHAFDAVRISHVLEHVPQPNQFIRELRRVLKPGGILAITVPHREPMSFWLVNTLRRFRGNRRMTTHIGPPGHVLGLDPKSLIDLMKRCGFKPLRVLTVSMGSRTFFPMFYDGLLFRVRLADIPIRSLVRYWLPQLIDTLANRFGRGQWLVGYFTYR
jgi:SAM-dependent methyltransferase